MFLNKINFKVLKYVVAFIICISSVEAKRRNNLGRSFRNAIKKSLKKMAKPFEKVAKPFKKMAKPFKKIAKPFKKEKKKKPKKQQKQVQQKVLEKKIEVAKVIPPQEPTPYEIYFKENPLPFVVVDPLPASVDLNNDLPWVMYMSEEGLGKRQDEESNFTVSENG